MMNRVTVFDTTLRDGAQMTGITFSARDKIAIAEKLDEIGVDYIEGGFPGSNPKDQEFFLMAKKRNWKHARICAFGPTHHKNVRADEDAHLRALLASEAPVVVLFGKSSRFHAEEILQVSADRNLQIIEDSVRLMSERGREVIFDAEHFFDGFFEDREYALECLLAAERGGAANLTLADTNGGMLPEQISEAIGYLKDKVKTPLGIHAHNDSDLAVANTLTAVASGAELVQGTVNGLGERCGNANLCSIMPNLRLKMGYDILSEENLRKLTELSLFVQELCNINARKDLPFVGRWAFRHKGGVHVSAMRKNPNSYQHIDPQLVGNLSSSAISELSGRANVFEFLEKNDIIADDKQAAELLVAIKEAENRGLTYEGGEASLEVLARKIIENRKPPFSVIDYFVHTGKIATNTDPVNAIEATVRIEAQEVEFHTAGFGSGPVNALDIAIRKALEPLYPQLKEARLVDFKVRIIDAVLGTSAKTHVQIETRGAGGEIWRTVGCSQNIIAASMDALFDSIVYAIWKSDSE